MRRRTAANAAEPAGPAQSRAVPAALDEIDWKLLRELQHDPRSPYNALGEAVGLTGDSVRERLRRLERDEVVKVIGVVDPAALGVTSFALVGLNTGGPLDEVLADLSDITEADFIVCATGAFDILVELSCRDDVHLLDVLANRIRPIAAVQHHETFAYLQIVKWNEPVERRTGRAVSQRDAAAVTLDDLDAVDLDLLRLLHGNGRATYKELAESAGVPYSTARRRAQHLFDSGIVRAVPLVNRVNVGVGAMAAVGLVTEGPVAAVADELAQIEEVELVIVSSGRFDVLIEVACADREALVELVTERIRSIAGVRSTETMTYLDIVRLPEVWSISG